MDKSIDYEADLPFDDQVGLKGRKRFFRPLTGVQHSLDARKTWKTAQLLPYESVRELADVLVKAHVVITDEATDILQGTPIFPGPRTLTLARISARALLFRW